MHSPSHLLNLKFILAHFLHSPYQYFLFPFIAEHMFRLLVLTNPFTSFFVFIISCLFIFFHLFFFAVFLCHISQFCNTIFEISKLVFYSLQSQSFVCCCCCYFTYSLSCLCFLFFYFTLFCLKFWFKQNYSSPKIVKKYRQLYFLVFTKTHC